MSRVSVSLRPYTLAPAICSRTGSAVGLGEGSRRLINWPDTAMRDHIAATDDADLVERIGGRVEIVESEFPNLKITTAADLELAEALVRAGQGS